MVERGGTGSKGSYRVERRGMGLPERGGTGLRGKI